MKIFTNSLLIVIYLFIHSFLARFIMATVSCCRTLTESDKNLCGRQIHSPRTLAPAAAAASKVPSTVTQTSASNSGRDCDGNTGLQYIHHHHTSVNNIKSKLYCPNSSSLLTQIKLEWRQIHINEQTVFRHSIKHDLSDFLICFIAYLQR